MKKIIPSFRCDREADEFVASADLGKYDLSGTELVQFALKPMGYATAIEPALTRRR